MSRVQQRASRRSEKANQQIDGRLRRIRIWLQFLQICRPENVHLLDLSFGLSLSVLSESGPGALGETPQTCFCHTNSWATKQATAVSCILLTRPCKKFWFSSRTGVYSFLPGTTIFSLCNFLADECIFSNDEFTTPHVFHMQSIYSRTA